MYLLSTLSTLGHSSPYLCPGTWVLISGSLQMGLKWFFNLWDTYWVLGFWVQSYGSGHMGLPNVWPDFHVPWFIGPKIQDPNPKIQDPDCRSRDLANIHICSPMRWIWLVYFFGLFPGRVVCISWIWLVYSFGLVYFFGLLPGRAVSISWIWLVYFFWFTSREDSTNWLWFTLVYLQTIDGLLIFAILLVYSGLLGFEIYFLDMSAHLCI